MPLDGEGELVGFGRRGVDFRLFENNGEVKGEVKLKWPIKAGKPPQRNARDRAWRLHGSRSQRGLSLSVRAPVLLSVLSR